MAGFNFTREQVTRITQGIFKFHLGQYIIQKQQQNKTKKYWENKNKATKKPK